MPLGVMPGGYDEAVVEVEAGSTLVLYTDGLVEERGEPIDDGMERMRQAVLDGPDDPEALCDHVLKAMGRSERAADDVALFVLRTVPVAVEEPDARAVDPAARADRPASHARPLARRGRRVERGVAGHPDGGDEAACNSMEHAYGFEEATFQLDAHRSNGKVSITVRDTGGWREPRKSDRGRGLDLMRALMDDVELEAGDAGTTVRMTRMIGLPDQNGNGAG